MKGSRWLLILRVIYCLQFLRQGVCLSIPNAGRYFWLMEFPSCISDKRNGITVVPRKQIGKAQLCNPRLLHWPLLGHFEIQFIYALIYAYIWWCPIKYNGLCSYLSPRIGHAWADLLLLLLLPLPLLPSLWILTYSDRTEAGNSPSDPLTWKNSARSQVLMVRDAGSCLCREVKTTKMEAAST